MGAGLVVVCDIVFDDLVQLLFSQDKDVVQAFAPHTAQKPLAERVGPGCFIRRPKHLDATGLRNPVELLSVFAIVVPYQEPCHLPEWGSLPQDCASLHLSSPVICWGSSNTEVDNSSGAEFDNKEDEKRPEEQIINRKEIARPDLVRMVVQERAPVLIRLALRRTESMYSAHVLLDSALTHSNVELEQFSANTFCSL